MTDVVPDKLAGRASARAASADPGPITTGGCDAKKEVTSSSRNDSGLWLWVPAFAGTTGEFVAFAVHRTRSRHLVALQRLTVQRSHHPRMHLVPLQKVARGAL